MDEKKLVVTRRPGFKLYKPHQLGWLRRTDDHGPRTWERPDGTLYTFVKGQPEVVVVKNQRKRS
jgi:hypothetical protein